MSIVDELLGSKVLADYRENMLDMQAELQNMYKEIQALQMVADELRVDIDRNASMKGVERLVEEIIEANADRDLSEQEFDELCETIYYND
jgi:SMC interacting uncharacterized protein involved in chromosome segregation